MSRTVVDLDDDALSLASEELGTTSKVATVNAADLMGWSGKVGALTPGAFADLIAVRGDPLGDVTELERVTFVMKGGKVVRNAAR